MLIYGRDEYMIRPATLTDAQAIAEIHVASWQAAYKGLLPDQFLENLSVQRRLQMWQQILAQDNNQAWVAVADGQPVGFTNFGPSRDEDADSQIVGEMYTIYLLPLAWGQGFGRALCTQTLTSLRESGYKEVMLWVLDSNEAAIYFYERVGFQADGTIKTERWADILLSEARYRQAL